MAYVSVEDFFAAGIGFDLGGGYLVARGLLSPPRLLTQLAGSYYDSNVYLGTSVATNRLDAECGLVALGIGFVLQALGYLLTLAEAPTLHGQRGAAIVGGLLVLAAVASVVGAGRLNRTRRLRPLLVEMAHFQGDGRRLELPRADTLKGWGKALNLVPANREDDLSFLKRTFGIPDALVRETGGYRRLSEGADGQLIADE